MMARLHEMQVFAKVAETGGFAEAARQLAMSPPAVTRAVAALEDAIGTRLLVRTTRSVKLTEAGLRYHQDCRRILADIAEAEATAAGSYTTPTGTLSITASVLFGQIYVLPLLTDFLDLYPAVTVQALFLDRMTHLVDEGIDVAIRIGHLPDSSLAATKVGSVRRVVCAAPSYLESQGTPTHRSDLTQHRIIAATSAYATLDWAFGRDETIHVSVDPKLSCSTYDSVIAAAVKGWGLARPLSYQIGPALAAGTLTTVLNDFEPEPLPIHIVHPDGRRASAKVRAFVDFAAERLRNNPMIN